MQIFYTREEATESFFLIVSSMMLLAYSRYLEMIMSKMADLIDYNSLDKLFDLKNDLINFTNESNIRDFLTPDELELLELANSSDFLRKEDIEKFNDLIYICKIDKKQLEGVEIIDFSKNL